MCVCFSLPQLLKKKGTSSFLQRLERGGPTTVAIQLRVSEHLMDRNLQKNLQMFKRQDYPLQIAMEERKVLCLRNLLAWPGQPFWENDVEKLGEHMYWTIVLAAQELLKIVCLFVCFPPEITCRYYWEAAELHTTFGSLYKT